MFNINDITRGLLGSAALTRRGGTPGPAPLPADIDLTTAALDSRVAYTGPAHAYLNNTGGVSSATANTWPLEYLNGVVVGRHAPEPAATNIITDNRFANVASGANAWTSTGGGVRQPDPGAAIDGGDGYKLSNTYVKPAIYNGASFILPDTSSWTDKNLSATWMRRRVAATFAGVVAAARFYIGRQDPSNYLYFQNGAGPGQVVMSVFKREYTADNTVGVSLPQVEAGAIATSPILSGTTRAASSVTVAKDGDTDGVVVHFNTGSSVQLPFNGAAAVTLPLSDTDWASRYITRISYYQEG